MSETIPIGIVVNGERQTVPGGLSVLDLVKRLDLDPARLAIELNREIVRRPEWGSQLLSEGSEVEIVQFVGGG